MPVRHKEAEVDSGAVYGLSLRKIGKNVRHAYKMTHTAIQAVTTLKTVRLTLNKKTARPAKKRKREMWSSVGINSIIQGNFSLSTPLL